jgi:hypothetical protein
MKACLASIEKEMSKIMNEKQKSFIEVDGEPQYEDINSEEVDEDFFV